MSNCLVCCEKIKFNVSCSKCKYNCCRVCVRTYLCGQLTDPHCMNCKTKWTLEFVEEAVGSTFFKNDFKKAQINTYYEFEKTQLPLIQDNIKEFLFNERKKSIIKTLTDENKKKIIGKYGCFKCVGELYYSDDCVNCVEDIGEEIQYNRNNVCKYLHSIYVPEKFKQIKKEYNIQKYLNNNFDYRCYCGSILYYVNNNKNPYYKCANNKHTLPPCKKKYCKICFDVLNEDNSHQSGECIPITNKWCPCITYSCDKCDIELNKSIIYRLYSTSFNGTSPDAERKKFIMKCQSENCPGFLSTQYKCGVCDVYTCSECLETKDDDHECKKENIESAKMIKKETRSCPTCATRIYKIDGCDQMWCVDCKTAFSWNSGQISNTRIHNPHYYEYLRQTNGGVIPREPGDIPGGAAACVQFPTLIDLRDYLTKLGYAPVIDEKYSEENKILTKRVKNIYTIFTHNVSEFHKFIVEMDELVRDDNVNIYNKDLIQSRVLYSLSRMDINTFKNKAYMYHQKSNHHNNYIQVMRMFKQVCKDLFEYVVEIIRDLKKLDRLIISSDLSAVRLVQYTYLLEKNNKMNDIFKQLMNSIIYIDKNLTKNKYYTNDCDKAKIIINSRNVTEEDLDEKIVLNMPKSMISPYNIKWNKHAYMFEFRYSVD